MTGLHKKSRGHGPIVIGVLGIPTNMAQGQPKKVHLWNEVRQSAFAQGSIY